MKKIIFHGVLLFSCITILNSIKAANILKTSTQITQTNATPNLIQYSGFVQGFLRFYSTGKIKKEQVDLTNAMIKLIQNDQLSTKEAYTIIFTLEQFFECYLKNDKNTALKKLKKMIHKNSINPLQLLQSSTILMLPSKFRWLLAQPIIQHLGKNIKKLITENKLEKTIKNLEAVFGKDNTNNTKIKFPLQVTFKDSFNSPLSTLGYPVITPDFSRILVVTSDNFGNNAIQIINPISGIILKEFQCEAPVLSCMFSPDQKNIIASLNNNTVKTWNIQNGQFQTLIGHKNFIISTNVNCAKTQIATGSYDQTAKIWDFDTGNILETFQKHTDAVFSASFSPDGKKIATASADKTVIIWDRETKKPLKTLTGHSGTIYSVVFSPNGKILLTGSYDKTAKIWSPETGECLQTLSGHTKPIININFINNGKQILTISRDNTVKIWNTKNGKYLLTINPQTDMVHSAIYNPLKKIISITSHNGEINQWEISKKQSLCVTPQEKILYEMFKSSKLKAIKVEENSHVQKIATQLNNRNCDDTPLVPIKNKDRK